MFVWLRFTDLDTGTFGRIPIDCRGVDTDDRWTFAAVIPGGSYDISIEAAVPPVDGVDFISAYSVLPNFRVPERRR